jgi:hypothetical protein
MIRAARRLIADLGCSLCRFLWYAFSSHQKVWPVVEPDDKPTKVYVGGNMNRNRPTF